MQCIVTVKLEKNPEHDPKNKKTGPCPVDATNACTDITGAHHSILFDGTIAEAQEWFSDYHITRVEYV